MVSSGTAASVAPALASGASLAGSTVSVKSREVVCVPSLTLTVIVDVPKALSAGLTTSVRLAPLPPSTRLVPVCGTSVVLLLLAQTVSVPAALSSSPTVKANVGVLASSPIATPPNGVSVGGSLTLTTVSLNVLLDLLLVPSVAVTLICTVPTSAPSGVPLKVSVAASKPSHAGSAFPSAWVAA